jgi:hypothetical protein
MLQLRTHHLVTSPFCFPSAALRFRSLWTTTPPERHGSLDRPSTKSSTYSLVVSDIVDSTSSSCRRIQSSPSKRETAIGGGTPSTQHLLTTSSSMQPRRPIMGKCSALTLRDAQQQNLIADLYLLRARMKGGMREASMPKAQRLTMLSRRLTSRFEILQSCWSRMTLVSPRCP